MLRTAWRAFHLSNRCWVSFDSPSRLKANRRLFVGIITINVYGTTRPRNTPPVSHHKPPPANQALTANTKPNMASGACIAAPRLELGAHSLRASEIPQDILAGCSTRLT